MKLSFSAGFILALICSIFAFDVCAESTRDERRHIMDGNKLYIARKFKEAAESYRLALKENPSSAVAKYNLGMAQIRQVSNPKDTTSHNVQLLENGAKQLSEVASLAKEKPGLASKSAYNLGNLAFNREDYSTAIENYKTCLRIDPNDNNARKNLRIAQLKQQQNQNQDKNQNKNKDNKDQEENKDQAQNKDKNDSQDKQNQDKQNQDKGNINNQTASQILQAIDNKESQTRARVNRANKGEKAESAGRRLKKW